MTTRILVLFWFLLLFDLSSNAQAIKKVIRSGSEGSMEIFHVLKDNPNIKNGKSTLKVRCNNGLFTKETGNYVNNSKEGIWMIYFDPDSVGSPSRQIKFMQSYKYGLKDGPFLEMSSDNDTIAFGNYVNNKRKGNWMIYENNKRIIISYE
ncbi:MAG: hypothetical protein ABFD10_20470 [Prolixibacteraceae bacterium]